MIERNRLRQKLRKNKNHHFISLPILSNTSLKSSIVLTIPNSNVLNDLGSRVIIIEDIRMDPLWKRG